MIEANTPTVSSKMLRLIAQGRKSFEIFLLAAAVAHLLALYGFWREIGFEKQYEICGMRYGDLVPYVAAGSASIILIAYLLHFVPAIRFVWVVVFVPFWFFLFLSFCG